MEKHINNSTLSINFYKYFFLFCIFISFYLISYLQPYGISRDILNYFLAFDYLRDSESWDHRFEYGFIFVVKVLSNTIDNNNIVYAILVAIAATPKIAFFIKCSSGSLALFFTLTILILRFVPALELTQLRLAFSMTFFLYFFYELNKGRYAIAIISAIGSILFHQTAIVPIFFALALQFNKYIKTIFISFLILIIIDKNEIIAEIINFSITATMYENIGFESTIKPFSASIILDWLLILFGLFSWGGITSIMRKIIILLLVSMLIFYSALEYHILAQRLRELFLILVCLYVMESFKCSFLIKTLSIFYVIMSVILYQYIFFTSFSG
jgi:hypothetical protein